MSDASCRAASDRHDLIRDLNDAMRRTLPFVGSDGRVVITDGVAQLHVERLTELLLSIRDFADFDASDDLWGEHDFGMVELGMKRFFWKIDYYDQHFRGAADDPADSAMTGRVLTIMCADEY